jgi:hypothetical protein
MQLTPHSLKTPGCNPCACKVKNHRFSKVLPFQILNLYRYVAVALAVCHLDDAALAATASFFFRFRFRFITSRSSSRRGGKCSSVSAAAAADGEDGDSAGAAASETPAIDYDDLPADPAERRRQIEKLNPPNRGGGGGGGDSVAAVAPGSSSVGGAPPSAAARLARVSAPVASAVLIVAALVNAAAMFRVEMMSTAADGDGDGVSTSSSSFSQQRRFSPKVSLAVGVTETNAWLEVVVPLALSYFWMFVLPAAAAVHAYREARRSRSWPVAVLRVAAAAVALALAVAVFGVTARPLASIVPSRAGSLAVAAALPSLGAATDASILRAASKLHISSGYGLFRRMTGVGAARRGGSDDNDDDAHRVARPEIVLQGSADGRNWKELEFRHKPGDPSSPPTWVAPHQPRLVGGCGAFLFSRRLPRT